MTDAEQARLMKGSYGRELLKTIQACVAPLYWGNREAAVLPSNGSAFVLRTDIALFGVTAKHVYNAFEEQVEHGGSAFCRLQNLEVDLRSRLISRGNQYDLATFEILPSELDRIEGRPAPWPPVIPSEGESVLISGFPGIGKRMSESGLKFGMVVSLTRVDSCSDHDISMVRPPDNEVCDVEGNGLPPRGFDMSGMSGGPVFAVLETIGGIVSWALAGVIYECGIHFEITKAIRADRIGDDGVIRE